LTHTDQKLPPDPPSTPTGTTQFQINCQENDFSQYPAYNMAMKSRNLSILTILLTLVVFPTSAVETQSTWITSTFSDENSMDVLIQSSQQVNNGQFIFKLTSQRKIIETTTLDFTIAPDKEITTIIMWDPQPQFKTYMATASVLVDGRSADLEKQILFTLTSLAE